MQYCVVGEVGVLLLCVGVCFQGLISNGEGGMEVEVEEETEKKKGSENRFRLKDRRRGRSGNSG